MYLKIIIDNINIVANDMIIIKHFKYKINNIKKDIE
jgi:hypothetical protein